MTDKLIEVKKDLGNKREEIVKKVYKQLFNVNLVKSRADEDIIEHKDLILEGSGESLDVKGVFTSMRPNSFTVELINESMKIDRQGTPLPSWFDSDVDYIAFMNDTHIYLVPTKSLRSLITSNIKEVSTEAKNNYTIDDFRVIRDGWNNNMYEPYHPREYKEAKEALRRCFYEYRTCLEVPTEDIKSISKNVVRYALDGGTLIDGNYTGVTAEIEFEQPKTV